MLIYNKKQSASKLTRTTYLNSNLSHCCTLSFSVFFNFKYLFIKDPDTSFSRIVEHRTSSTLCETGPHPSVCGSLTDNMSCRVSHTHDPLIINLKEEPKKIHQVESTLQNEKRGAVVWQTEDRPEPSSSSRADLVMNFTGRQFSWKQNKAALSLNISPCRNDTAASEFKYLMQLEKSAV